jgi:hypothetical protein
MSHLINNMQHFLLHILCCMFLRFQDYVEVIVILQWHKGVSTRMTTMQAYMYLFTHLWSQHLTITWNPSFCNKIFTTISPSKPIWTCVTSSHQPLSIFTYVINCCKETTISKELVNVLIFSNSLTTRWHINNIQERCYVDLATKES